jgi:excinuclease UvrABC helicase subunit UvrB
MRASDYIGVAVIVLSIVQISPIKINPWTKIARAIGKMLNADVMDVIEKGEATNKRYRILRFDDEIRHHTKHTFEHFNQILEDIDEYEKYCNSHPLFMNNKAGSAIKNIKEVYEKCRRENSFLI